MEIWKSVRFSAFFNPKPRFQFQFFLGNKKQKPVFEKPVFEKQVFAYTKQNTIVTILKKSYIDGRFLLKKLCFFAQPIFFLFLKTSIWFGFFNFGLVFRF